MRRATIAIGIVAILASSCGAAAIDAPVAATLEQRVATIRRHAEEGRPGLARAALDDLMVLVIQRMEAGRIDQTKAMEILDAAELVALRLSLLPRPEATASPSPPPPEDEGKPDKDEKPGKGNGRGDGDEGHGNDD